MNSQRSIFVLILIFSILLLDQGLKIWIKLNMSLSEHFNVFGLEWFQIYFTENKGMAFGIEFGANYGKLFLSLFRLVAITGMGYMLIQFIKKNSSYGVLVSLSLILAGAIGNILDSAFYGLAFSESLIGKTAVLFPTEGGYAPFLYGKVVDMFYFPLIDTTFPHWVPYWGGSPFRFFQAIFNVADASICIGVTLVFIFHKHFFVQESNAPSPELEQLSNNTISST